MLFATDDEVDDISTMGTQLLRAGLAFNDAM
jgi:hypothetical protein